MEQGIAQVNAALGDAIGQRYVARYFPPEHRARMQTLVANLLAAYRDSITHLTWMSEATKAGNGQSRFRPRRQTGRDDRKQRCKGGEFHHQVRTRIERTPACLRTHAAGS